MSRWLGICVVMVFVVSACTGAESSDPGTTSSAPEQSAPLVVTSSTTQPSSTTSTATDAPPSTAPPPVTFPLAETVSFLDGCVSGVGLVGSCRCALSAVAGLVAVEDLAALEDQFLGTGQLPLVVEEAIAGCEGASEPEPDQAVVAELASECTLGDSRLNGPCQCAAERAVQIVPAGSLAEWSNRTDVDPSLIDLLNRCLAL